LPQGAADENPGAHGVVPRDEMEFACGHVVKVLP
jgi:hypothetical protein